VAEGAPALLVKVGNRGPHDDDKALADDPVAFARTLVELLAHEADDETLGAFCRTVLEPVRVAGIGQWKWSRRVMYVRPEERTCIGGAL
jgi:hypothetical protein